MEVLHFNAPPKCQRLTLKCCSAISPRLLCRGLVRRQQQEHAQIPRRFGIYQAAGAGAWLHSVCFPFPLPVLSAWLVQQPLCISGAPSQGWAQPMAAASERLRDGDGRPRAAGLSQGPRAPTPSALPAAHTNQPCHREALQVYTSTQ